MHDSQRIHMRFSVEKYLKKHRHYDVLDFGSAQSKATHETHRRVLKGYKFSYTGADVREGHNVDVLMTKPYRVPVKANSYDVVITGSVFEHVPFPFASMMEIARILRPGGFVFFTAPGRGHKHTGQDCWRYMPDATRSLAAFSRLELREVYSDNPPRMPNSRFYDYARIDTELSYWGDVVAVFQKPRQYSKLIVPVREAVIWWANRVGGIDGVERPGRVKGRATVVARRVAREKAAAGGG